MKWRRCILDINRHTNSDILLFLQKWLTDCLTSLIKNKQFVQQENILIVLPQLSKILLIHFSFGIMEYAIATCFITTFEVFTQGNIKKNYFYTYLKQSELYF